MAPIYSFPKVRSEKSEVEISKIDLIEIVHGFAHYNPELSLTVKTGLEALHDAVNSALTHVDLPEEDRERINDFINALQNVYEAVREQDPKADHFTVDACDLDDIAGNVDCLGMAIRVHHLEFNHYEVSNALLWAKTSIKSLARKNWNIQLAECAIETAAIEAA